MVLGVVDNEWSQRTDGLSWRNIHNHAFLEYVEGA